MWTFNSRVFPGIDHLAVRQGDRVRVRVGNLTMTNHPIHMHGYHFSVTCTDGGWVPESARWPETTIDLPVGAMRAYEFVADVPGDWALHCHKSHHTMNAMGHDVKTYIGVDQKDVRKKISKLLGGGLHADGLGRHGRDGRDGDGGARQHAAHDDGLRPVRPDRDGRHVHGGEGARGAGAPTTTRTRAGTSIPQGTVAYEWQGEKPRHAEAPRVPPDASVTRSGKEIELKAVKPGPGKGHGRH